LPFVPSPWYSQPAIPVVCVGVKPNTIRLLVSTSIVESASCSLKAFVEKLGVKPNCAQWFRDYATFMISVMNKEGVSQEIAAQRQNITRNLIVPEVESVLCEDATDPANCKVAMGFGLGWRVVK
jgi:hypothetical protein